jgi:hypothetical protein
MSTVKASRSFSAPPSAKRQLASFITCFSPEIAKLTRATLSTMREYLPGAYELVYDNAYALVVGFGPSPRPSEAIFSVVAYPKKVALCFLYGASLPDPEGMLQGSGNQVRHIRIANARTLRQRNVLALIVAALAGAGEPFVNTVRGETIVRAISKNRRPRRTIGVPRANSASPIKKWAN